MTEFLIFLLGLAIAGLAFLGFQAFQLNSKAEALSVELAAQRARCEADIKQSNEYSTALKAENQRLSKYKNVADADVKAAEMLKAARATVDKANADVKSFLAATQQRASAQQAEVERNVAAQLEAAKDSAIAAIVEAKEKAKALKEEAQAILNGATVQAAKTIETADKRAEEIAGSAYEAMKNAALYERTVKAMKNVIEGYGDEYIIPEASLLDDLAEDFSHAQAGQELKRARDQTKVMIRNATAAACDYVEANRRETAVNFVIDAFNGKVDSILSRVKHDNAGKLAQQIRDAFTLVNFQGKAFREARITDEFLAARLDELKWAEVAQLLALEEREEQRLAKEQIREQARVAKETERAFREAAKEEETLQKGIEKGRELAEHATGEQKVMYEKRLQEMEDRLREALERKERARSMAQQTKKGSVYIISNVGSLGEDVFKIGLTRRWDPWDRVRELGDASVPFDFDVHAMILSDDAPKLERHLHTHFLLRQINKVNHRKEFFRATLKEIRDEIESLGLTTGIKWTMTAEAKIFRESLAIEKAIKDDPATREAWIKRQMNMELAASEDFEAVDASAEDE